MSEISSFFKKRSFEIAVSSFVFLLPFGKTFWLPIAFMLVMGSVALFKRLSTHSLGRPDYVYGLIFLCFWIPAWLSVPDAYDAERAIKFCFVSLGLFICGFYLLSKASLERIRGLIAPLTAIVIFWSATVALQFFSGGYFFGENVGGRYQGVFGDNMILGYMLVPLTGLVVYGWLEKNRTVSWLMLVVMLSTIYLSANRAAWVSSMVLVGGLVFSHYLKAGGVLLKDIKWFYPSAIAAVAVVVLATYGSDTGGRLNHTLSFVKDPDFKSVNASSAGRIEIWSTALDMASDNLWNGVGARSFRYAYPDYSPGSRFVHEVSSNEGFEQQGPLYVHQIVLQVLTDTGLPGLLGILIFYALIAYGYFKGCSRRSILQIGGMASFIAMVFPINTHLNIFGGTFGSVFWLFTALTVYMAYGADEEKKEVV